MPHDLNKTLEALAAIDRENIATIAKFVEPFHRNPDEPDFDTSLRIELEGLTSATLDALATTLSELART